LDALAAAIGQLLSDSSQARRLGEQARKAVVAQFGLDAAAQRWRGIYTELNGSAP
jgi:glycosyltransferase involved in cell wall biosynthesis